MDPIIELEKEIEHYRKILSEKEEELYRLKSDFLNNKKKRDNVINENGSNSTQIGDKLPKWAIERYSRQILLPEIGVSGQQKLCAARVLVVGAGGLGCPAAVYLAGAGIAEIGIVDYDTVELTNIHRQFLHSERDEGLSKAESVAHKLRSINSRIKVTPYTKQLDSTSAQTISSSYDIILDCTDNVPTRYLLNDLCVMSKKPLISGSALKMEGQLTVYGYRDSNNGYSGPCYRCMFPVPPPPEAVGSCSANGVAGPVPGTIGSLQALEAIKLITGQSREQLLVQRMLLFDGENMSFKTVKLRGMNTDCAVCSDNPSITKLIDYELFCNSRAQEKDLDLQILKPEQRISSQDLSLYLNDCEQRHLLVDVRTESEFQMCNIDGSVNHPIEKLDKDFEKIIENIQKYERVTFICRRGNDSQIAAQKFMEFLKNDVIKVVDVIGGLHAWAKHVDNKFPVY